MGRRHGQAQDPGLILADLHMAVLESALLDDPLALPDTLRQSPSARGILEVVYAYRRGAREWRESARRRDLAAIEFLAEVDGSIAQLVDSGWRSTELRALRERIVNRLRYLRENRPE